MNTAGLSFDQIPALRIPYGFFITAPLFGCLAGCLLVLFPELLTSRWQPAMLAWVHLLTLGVAAQVMLGALCQVLPVIGGTPIRLGWIQALMVRTGLSLGTLMLAGSFLVSQPWLAAGSVALLAAALGLFCWHLAGALLRVRPAGDTLNSIRQAALALVVTVIAGVLLQWLRHAPADAPALLINTDQHALWGGMGWMLLLVIGVSFQVIPMFHVAPDFPRWTRRLLPSVLWLSLLVVTLSSGTVQQAAMASLLVAALYYCFVAARTLQQRKRKIIDYTVRFWMLGLSAISAALLLGLSSLMFGLTAPVLAQGILFGFGGILSIIIGMLQKIVPFLLYLHLQRTCLSAPDKLLQLPNMKRLLPTERSRVQWWLQLGCLSALLLALVWPVISYLCGVLMLANFGWLGLCLYQARRLYDLHIDTPAPEAETVDSL